MMNNNCQEYDFSMEYLLLYCHNRVNVQNSRLFGRDVLSYAIECKYLSEALETFYHHYFYKR